MLVGEVRRDGGEPNTRIPVVLEEDTTPNGLARLDSSSINSDSAKRRDFIARAVDVCAGRCDNDSREGFNVL
eukprot:scaffold370_cov176-Amphora_coffeaeformis.AAC.4